MFKNSVNCQKAYVDYITVEGFEVRMEYNAKIKDEAMLKYLNRKNLYRATNNGGEFQIVKSTIVGKTITEHTAVVMDSLYYFITGKKDYERYLKYQELKKKEEEEQDVDGSNGICYTK